MSLNPYADRDTIFAVNTGATDPGYPGLFTDTGPWTKSTFTYALQRDFKTYKEVLEYSLQDEIYDDSETGERKVPDAMQEQIDEAGNTDGIPRELLDKKFRDTSLGGNDAINCYYQFNENDDIIHPFHSLGTDTGLHGMGRVYSENIDDNQQIMYMSFGLPEFRGIARFYKDAINKNLSEVMNGKDFFSIKKIGRMFGKTVGTILVLPFLPIAALRRVPDLIPDLASTKVSKYYHMRSEMPLYYKCVNTMIAHLAVNMGFVMPGEEDNTAGSKLGKAKTSAKDQTFLDIYRNEEGANGLPEVFRKHGWDIFSIMSKKYLYNEVGDTISEEDLNIDNIVERYVAEGEDHVDEDDQDAGFSPWERFTLGFNSGVREALTYVGFRIEKSVDNMEAISNSTGESSLAGAINSKADSAREAKFSMMEGKTNIGIIDNFIAGVQGVVGGFTKSVGIDGITGVLAGSGRVDIPEIWKDSNFTKNYSFNMALRSPYGDPVSIMQSIYIPLSMLLAAALPRAVGANAYTSPFLLSAYSRGMYAIPLGIIDSMSIRRGAEQHGWSYQNLPTCIDISFTIKDLSPTMYMAIADGMGWHDVFGQNSTFQEYLLTLSGVGIVERMWWSRNLKRKIAMIKQIARHDKLNPVTYGFGASMTKVGRVIAAMTSTVDLEREREQL